MKIKQILLCMLLACFILPASAQNSWGIVGGGLFSKSLSRDARFSLGGYAGGMYDVHVKNSWYVQPQLLFTYEEFRSKTRLGTDSFFSKFTPKEPKFFPLLKQLSDVLSASSVLLVESLEHDLPTERADYYKQIKDMEREGDRLTHLIFDELSTTFITPFDREDIHDLASCMDDVIDGINSSAKRIVIYNPRPISESGKELSRLIHEEAINIGKAMDELETFRKNPKPLRDYCTQLHDIENQADDVYELFITKLFEEEKDCIELIKIKEIMHELEKTTDAAEHVGKILKNLIVKYS